MKEFYIIFTLDTISWKKSLIENVSLKCSQVLPSEEYLKNTMCMRNIRGQMKEKRNIQDQMKNEKNQIF